MSIYSIELNVTKTLTDDIHLF